MNKCEITKMAPICRSENEECKVDNIKISKQSNYDIKEPPTPRCSFRSK